MHNIVQIAQLSSRKRLVIDEKIVSQGRSYIVLVHWQFCFSIKDLARISKRRDQVVLKIAHTWDLAKKIESVVAEKKFLIF